MIRYLSLLALALALGVPAAAQPLAFPGAVGWAATTPGGSSDGIPGSGETVLHGNGP